MKTTKLKLAALAFASLISVAGAQSGSLESRLPGLVVNGRISVIELSEEQQDSFGIEAAEQRLSTLLLEQRDSPSRRIDRRVALTAAQLAAVSASNVASSEDLTFSVFREIRSERLRLRIAADIADAETNFPAEFEAAREELLERLAAPEVDVADLIAEVEERIATVQGALDNAIENGFPDSAIQVLTGVLEDLQEDLANLQG